MHLNFKPNPGFKCPKCGEENWGSYNNRGHIHYRCMTCKKVIDRESWQRRKHKYQYVTENGKTRKVRIDGA